MTKELRLVAAVQAIIDYVCYANSSSGHTLWNACINVYEVYRDKEKIKFIGADELQKFINSRAEKNKFAQLDNLVLKLLQAMIDGDKNTILELSDALRLQAFFHRFEDMSPNYAFLKSLSEVVSDSTYKYYLS